MAYTLNIPSATQLVSASQPLIQDNFNSANTVMSVDHYPFADTTANIGRHKDIHIVKRVGNPTNVVDTSILYSKDYTPDTTGGTADQQFFAESGSGTIFQMTGKDTSNSTDGWCWCGGILIQWGRVTQAFSSGSTTGTVTFKDRVAGAIRFPNNCFVVNTTPMVSFASLPSSQASINIRASTLSATSFAWQFYTGSNQYIAFNWIAIGN